MAEKNMVKSYINEYSSNNYLHTYSAYFNPKLDSNLFTIKNSEDSLSNIENQKKILEENERAFYSLIFPTETFQGNGFNMFKQFLNTLKLAINPQDKAIFFRFSNLDAEGRNLYDVERSFMQAPDKEINPDIYKTMFGNNSPLTSWMDKAPDTSADFFRRELQISQNDDSLQNIHFQMVLNKKTLKRADEVLKKIKFDETNNEGIDIDINTLFKNAVDGYISGVEFSKQIGKITTLVQQQRKERIRKIADEYLNKYFDKGRLKNEEKIAEKKNRQRKEIMSALNKSFKKPSPIEIMMLFKQPIENFLRDKYKNDYQDQDIDIYMDWVFTGKWQQNLEWSFGEKGKFNTNNSKDVDKAKSRLRYIIDNLCRGGSDELQRAKEIVLSDIINVKDFSVSFSWTSISGLLGEFAGAMLYNYLIISGVSAKVAGHLRENFGEQNRADIIFENLNDNILKTGAHFYGGIQAKNWQESTIEKNLFGVNLHPIHFLQQIVSASNQSMSSTGIIQLKTLFANFAFNADSIKKIEKTTDILNVLLKDYLSFFLNLYGGVDANGNPLDTSPFWMVGAGIIIPGSLIIETIGEEVKKASHKDYSFQITTKGKGSDKYYAQHPEIINDYWIKNENGEWEPTEKHQSEIENLVNGSLLSIHTNFNMMQVMNNILRNMGQKASELNYDLLNVFK